MTLQFSGETYSAHRDRSRLSHQHQAVFRLMRDGQWRTLEEISLVTGHPEPSISARLRDLRKDRFGGHLVERQHVHGGLWQYRVVVNTGDGP